MTKPTAHDAKLFILNYAQETDIDSAHLVAALADIIGIIAALADKEAGYETFDARMEEFKKRVREVYLKGPPVPQLISMPAGFRIDGR
jgi:hypothetical protein